MKPAARNMDGAFTLPLIRDTSFIFLAIVWLGVLLGVSFLATPVKFLAPSLDLPTALDVGRVTFALFIKVEWVLCALLVAGVLAGQEYGLLRWSGVAVLAVILLVQTVWLLPVLDARVGQIMAGLTVPRTPHHLIYIIGEAAKALILFLLSIHGLRRLAFSRKGIPCA